MLASPGFAHEAKSCLDKELSYTDLDRTVIHFTLTDFDQVPVSIEGKEYMNIAVPGCAYFKHGAAGQPQLPRVSESLMIPDTARMAVTVLNSEYYEITEIDVAPSKGSILRSVDPATVPHVFGPEYGQDAFFPGVVAEGRDPYILRDVRAMVVDLYPFQYNAKMRVLRVYTSIEVEVKAVGQATQNVLHRNGKMTERPSVSFERMYMNQFGNYLGNRGDPPSEDGDMLIISHGPFMSAMQSFVDWKNSLGISTTMVDVATIGNNYTAIKNYITNVYNTSNLTFVLLVGDANEVKSMPYSGTVADPDYSTITADWYPDILVGRFSAQNVSHVWTQRDRTIAYETEGHDVLMGGWNAAALGVASNQGPGHYGEYDNQHVDLLLDELVSYGFTTITKSYDYSGTPAIITGALHDGVRTVQYTGHGGPTGWGNGGGYSNSDVDLLQNVGKLPFIVSVACNVGEFDYGTCFCEAWMRAEYNGQPTGAIAHYGSSVGQYWDEPMYGQGNHAIGNKYGALERFWMNMNWSIGCEWFGGSCCMMDLCGTPGQDMFRTWICFGDPSLRVYGAPGPQMLTVDSSAIPINQAAQINFTVCPGPDYANYKYCLLTGATGTQPGSLLPNGVKIPLNFDDWTFFALQFLNSSMFGDFFGVLDAQGEATATFDTAALVPIDPRLVGFHVYFCGILWPAGGGFEMPTNPKALLITN
jgi:hypothetical protein